MNLDRRKWRSSPGLPKAHLLQPPPRQEPGEKLSSDVVESRAPRVLTRALRSLSSSSMDSSASGLLRTSSATRRLQKSPSTAGSMINRLHRRVSRRSSPNSSPTFDAPPTSPVFTSSQPFHAMQVIQYGPLKADISLLKARSEYLVLSDECLIKFASGEAARSAFPQLTRPRSQSRDQSPRDPPSRPPPSDVRLEIPLHAVVAVFDEDVVQDRSTIEIWWFAPWPRLGYCKAHLQFALPRERDDWLASIQRACRCRARKNPDICLVPENLNARIQHIVRTAEGGPHKAAQCSIFPVAKRVFGTAQKTSAADEGHDTSDSSSFYFAIGPCMCHFIEVLKAHHSTAPGDLRVKATSYGTVTLTRFKASVVSYEQRFIVCFRSPFGRECRLDLASVQYRRIIEALTKADRILKPMWPQHFQQAIFDIKGLPPPLQLTSGNDLGGLRRSLQAYCAAYQVSVPDWKIEWSTPPQPEFRLLPPRGEPYSSLQLLAVFRALRYNSFFKAISFRDVDLSPLTGKKDCSQYGDALAFRSLNGQNVPEHHHEALIEAPILGQEMHALMFASESIKSIDLSNMLGQRSADRRQSRLTCDLDSLRRMSSEMLRPLLMLWREQMCACHSLSLAGCPLAPSDVDELSNVLLLGYAHVRKLDLARCALGDAGLTKLWTGLAGQADTIEWLDTSSNHGAARFDVLQGTLRQLRRITRLRIAGNTRIEPGESLLDEATLGSWTLQDLDLSDIALNDETVDALAAYLGTQQSHGLSIMRLNSCGLSGGQISRLFRAMGQARRVTVHLNSNRLDEGIDDLCGAVACGYAPWGLFLQMAEFAQETNYIKLLRALTVNKSIECLSLAGMAMEDAASSTACQAIADLLASNHAVRFLDLSGYDSKLDEGRLGRGFARALGGIKSNTRMEHLRVRSQMLNANVGDLAEAMAVNKTLRTLDCEGNELNLSNIRHLIKHLQSNTTLRHLSAFTDSELSCTIQKSVQTATTALPTHRSSVMLRFRPEKPPAGSGPPPVQQLKDEWDGAIADLERLLRRNRAAASTDRGDEDDEGDEAGSGRWRDADAEREFSMAFGGLALKTFERSGAKSVRGSVSPPRQPILVSPSENGVGRTNSGASSDVVVSPSTDEASSADVPSSSDLESLTDRDYSLGYDSPNGITMVVDEARDDGCTFCDGFDVDAGLVMKKYRCYPDMSPDRIEEEETGPETELGEPLPSRA